VIYCGECTLPSEYCKYCNSDKKYTQCLLWILDNDLSLFLKEINDLKILNMKRFNDIKSELLFKRIRLIYFLSFPEIITDDLVCLIAKYIGKLHDDVVYQQYYHNIGSIKKIIHKTVKSKNSKKIKQNRIVISMKNRKGHKKVTCIEGLLELNMKEKDALKAFRVRFATGVSCDFILGTKGPKQFIIQGDVRYDMVRFLRFKYCVPPKLLLYKTENELFNACDLNTGKAALP